MTDQTQDRGPRAAEPLWGPKPARGPIREVISGYRFYNPDLGRWINRDPIGEPGCINLQVFIYNGTINMIDNLGHEPMSGISSEEDDDDDDDGIEIPDYVLKCIPDAENLLEMALQNALDCVKDKLTGVITDPIGQEPVTLKAFLSCLAKALGRDVLNDTACCILNKGKPSGTSDSSYCGFEGCKCMLNVSGAFDHLKCKCNYERCLAQHGGRTHE